MSTRDERRPQIYVVTHAMLHCDHRPPYIIITDKGVRHAIGLAFGIYRKTYASMGTEDSDIELVHLECQGEVDCIDVKGIQLREN